VSRVHGGRCATRSESYCYCQDLIHLNAPTNLNRVPRRARSLYSGGTDPRRCARVRLEACSALPQFGRQMAALIVPLEWPQEAPDSNDST